jgi:hypothetical protein
VQTAQLTVFTYQFSWCHECECSHTMTIVAADEGEAWHEAIRSCSPEDSEVIEERPATPEEARFYSR